MTQKKKQKNLKIKLKVRECKSRESYLIVISERVD